MPSVDASIVICTFNRSFGLKATLQAVDHLDTAGLDVEVIVVDNNSRDNTKAVFEAWSRRARLPARYLFEAQQGLSFARNAGIGAAQGEIIAFTDDDVTVDGAWLKELVIALRTSGAAAAGGKILPTWAGAVPRWLTQDLHGYLALLDLGDAAIALDTPAIFGANFAVRASWFARGGFETSLGRIGGRFRMGEDTALLCRIMEQGGQLLYWPRAVVHHRVEPERMTKSYFRRWHYDMGLAQGEVMEVNYKRALFGIPYVIYRRVMEHAWEWAAASVKGKPAFTHELHIIRLAGSMRERLRRPHPARPHVRAENA